MWATGPTPRRRGSKLLPGVFASLLQKAAVCEPFDGRSRFLEFALQCFLQKTPPGHALNRVDRIRMVDKVAKYIPNYCRGRFA